MRYFEEKQKMNAWWLYVIFGFQLTIIACILIFSDELRGKASRWDSFLYILGVFSIPVLIIVITQSSTLWYRIDETGITYKYFFFRPKKHISWYSISSIHFRKYDAFSEYGGVGYRNKLWFKFRDRAYILNSENIGLQIEYSQHRRLLFSTNKQDELFQFLINLKNLKPNLPFDTYVRER
ncbi:MAG: hypothetical protein EOO99_09510 [Pedobacter sp.]|nr:MAG: hypothetical protein EOO99_09510 [Pedobacter sp.]